MLIDQLSYRDLSEQIKNQKMKEYLAASEDMALPESVNPIYEKLDDAEGGTLKLCDSTMKFIDNNNSKILTLQKILDDMAAWIEKQR